MVGKRQLLGIELGVGDIAGHTLVDQPFATLAQHAGIDVRQHHQPFRSDQMQQPTGQIAGSASQIQHSLARPHTADAHREPFPYAVHAERHQIVHQIVLAGHGIEHTRHLAGLVGGGHFLVAEMRGFEVFHARGFLGQIPVQIGRWWPASASRRR